MILLLLYMLSCGQRNYKIKQTHLAKSKKVSMNEIISITQKTIIHLPPDDYLRLGTVLSLFFNDNKCLLKNLEKNLPYCKEKLNTIEKALEAMMKKFDMYQAYPECSSLTEPLKLDQFQTQASICGKLLLKDSQLTSKSYHPDPNTQPKSNLQGRNSVKPTDLSIFFNCCYFPLKQYPVPAYPHERYDDGSFRSYGWTRGGGNQFHAATDLWGNIGDPVYAISDGVVNDIYEFYQGTYSIDIVHPQEGLLMRYAEVDSNSIRVQVGENIQKGQQIARIGDLGFGYQMVHFEGFWNYRDTQTYLSDRSRPTKRRADNFNITKMVQNWENNKAGGS